MVVVVGIKLAPVAMPGMKHRGLWNFSVSTGWACSPESITFLIACDRLLLIQVFSSWCPVYSANLVSLRSENLVGLWEWRKMSLSVRVLVASNRSWLWLTEWKRSFMKGYEVVLEEWFGMVGLFWLKAKLLEECPKPHSMSRSNEENIATISTRSYSLPHWNSMPGKQLPCYCSSH